MKQSLAPPSRSRFLMVLPIPTRCVPLRRKSNGRPPGCGTVSNGYLWKWSRPTLTPSPPLAILTLPTAYWPPPRKLCRPRNDAMKKAPPIFWKSSTPRTPFLRPSRNTSGLSSNGVPQNSSSSPLPAP